jgi:hypothetical protein
MSRSAPPANSANCPPSRASISAAAWVCRRAYHQARSNVTTDPRSEPAMRATIGTGVQKEGRRSKSKRRPIRMTNGGSRARQAALPFTSIAAAAVRGATSTSRRIAARSSPARRSPRSSWSATRLMDGSSSPTATTGSIATRLPSTAPIHIVPSRDSRTLVTPRLQETVTAPESSGPLRSSTVTV